MTLPQPLHKDAVPAPKTSESLSAAEIIEAVMMKGDLKALTSAERAGYLRRLCESLGLNPLTRPFEYITLQGKLTLYCTKSATEQLRKLHNVSVIETTESELEDIYIVKCRVSMPDGRTDEARGAVKIGGLKGDHLANALMKAESKAKRRATLSICGLGFIDETELETIDATKRKSSNAAKKDGETSQKFNNIRSDIQASGDYTTLQEVLDANAQEIATMPDKWAKMIENERQAKIQDFGGEPEWVEEG